jgi:hypothetical protein
MQTVEVAGVGSVGIERFQASLDNPDLATVQTVRAMCGHIRACAADPVVLACAQQALQQFGGLGAGLPREIAAADACWWWVKHRVRFVQDDDAIQALLNERYQLELLVTPSVLVRMARPGGDCDDFSMLLACLLTCLGMRWRIVVVAASPSEPEVFSHVFVAAVLADGSLYPLDASHGRYPGWHVPDERIFRSQLFDEGGRNVPGGLRGISAGLGRWRGLHGYEYIGLGAARPTRSAAPRRLAPYYYHGRTGHALRGLGCGCSELDDDNNCLDPDPCAAATSSGSSYTTVNPIATGSSVVSNIPLVTSNASVSTGQNWDSTINNLLASWTGIASKVIAPTTTVVTPSGLSITTPSNSLSQLSNLFSGSSLTGGSMSGSTLLILLGVLVVGVMAMGNR